MSESSQPLVTVVVPTYNRPDFLKKTARTILDQTYRNLELIIVSNGVNPANEQAARELNDPRVIYVDQENTGGPAAPRNHGLRLAKGKYVAFCDDDDLWLPQKIEKQVAAMENNPGYQFSYTKMTRLDETDREWSVPSEEGAASLKTLLYKSTIPNSSIMVLTDLAREVGGYCEDNRVRASEDYEFAVRCACRTDLMYVDEYLIKYWCGSNRISTTDQNRKVSDTYTYFRRVMYCHYLQIKSGRVPVWQFIGPFFYHLSNFLRASGYIVLKSFFAKTNSLQP